MTRADDRLKALFAADEPPARDQVFTAAVTERLVRRRCLQDMALLAAMSALGGVVLWGLWPLMEPVVVTLSRDLAPAAVALAAGFSIVAILGGFGGGFTGGVADRTVIAES